MKDRLDSPWFTAAFVAALVYVLFGVSLIRADVWTRECPPPLANSPKKLVSSTGKQSLQVRPLPAGWHTHRCQCGSSWSHGPESHGDVAKHTCPSCGRIQWHKGAPAKSIVVPVKACPT